MSHRRLLLPLGAAFALTCTSLFLFNGCGGELTLGALPDGGNDQSEGGPEAEAVATCTTNGECISKLGVPAVCVKGDQPPFSPTHCAPIESDSCKIFNQAPVSFTQYVGNDDAIVMASVDVVGANEHVADYVRAQALAFHEINLYGPGMPAVAGGRRRPILLLGCEMADTPSTTGRAPNAQAIVDHLRALGVTGVLGPNKSERVLELATAAVPAKLFQIAGFATSPALSNIQDEGLVWRVSPSSAHEGVALRALVADVEKRMRADLGLAPSENIKVAFVVLDNAFGQGIANKLREGFSFNDGRSDVGSTNPDPAQATFQTLEYMESAAGLSVNFTQMVDALVRQAPHIIVHIGGNELLENNVPSRLETKWDAALPYRPSWLFNRNVAMTDMGLLKLAQINPSGIRSRMRGVYTREHGNYSPESATVYPDLVNRFRTTFGLPVTSNIDAIQFSYDAAYALAYAYYAADPNKARVSGTEILAGMKKLLPSGPTPKLAVGPGANTDNIQKIFKVLQSGASIDLEGVTHNLNFDATLGELPIEQASLSVWCYGQCKGATDTPPCTVVAGGAPVFRESGQTYDPATRSITGVFDCP